jgi:hypothetical protein
MAKRGKNKATISLADCIAQLPEIPLEEVEKDQDGQLRRVELRHSILAIADLNHVTETKIVRSAVKNVLGEVPTLEE